MKLLGAIFLFLATLAARGQTVSITPSASTYTTTGGSITFTVNVSYAGEMRAIAIDVGSVPAGWALAGIGGANAPAVAPQPGDTGAFGFAYTTIPASPLSFTFSVNYPSGLAVNQIFGGIAAQFRAGTSGSTVTVTVPNIVLTPAEGGPPTAIAPVILTQPRNVTISAGGSAAFTVVASGTAVLSYEWRKDGAVVPGGNAAVLLVLNATASSAGSYNVVVTNAAGSAISQPATLAVQAAVAAPQITTQPAVQSVVAGGSTTLSVVATGAGPLTYQWWKDGVALAGAVSAVLSLTNVQPAAAGAYTVVVTNAAGSATSGVAMLTVTAAPPPPPPLGTRTYFGNFAANAGSFALYLRADRSGVFLAYARASRLGLVSRDVTVDAAGRFRVTVAGASAAEYAIDGSIAADGSLSGTVGGLNLAFAGPADGTTGRTAGLAGFFPAGVAGTGTTGYALVGTNGDALVVTVAGGVADAGRGTVDAAGRIEVATDDNARISGSVTAAAGTISLAVTRGPAPPVLFIGANNDARADVEKLINISTRSQTGGAALMIAGFVVTGTQPKALLVRAIGPTLGIFGVGNALPAARLQVMKGDVAVASGNDWGAAANAAAIAETATRVGAFALAPASHDAALLVTLEPGAYTAIVTGQGEGSGVSLVEVYDATAGPIPRAQRIVNISTRALAGAGDAALIAGFVINGTVPKRVLVRGVGPTLAAFGLDGTLARPQLAVNSGDTVLLRNAGWSTSADATAIAEASARVGAFALPVGSEDAALIIHLLPGAYTAQVSSTTGVSGLALLEVYELP
ncbi:MAG TPA: immunoglobulin domain-containing protein [Opitutaceae bacterium]|nr:immunoglobulin domain-containing protein [Opitutaceae bacterium]